MPSLKDSSKMVLFDKGFVYKLRVVCEPTTCLNRGIYMESWIYRFYKHIDFLLRAHVPLASTVELQVSLEDYGS